MINRIRCVAIHLSLILLIPFAHLIGEEPSLPPAKEYFYTDAILAEPPQVEITSDGIAFIKLKTTKPCHGVEAFFGIYPEDAELKFPVYRKSGKPKSIRPTEWLVRLKLRRLENKGVDINDFRGKSGGQVAYRLALYADKLYTLDRVFAYGRTADGEYFHAVAMSEGPLIDCVTDHNAILSWEFDQPARCRLEIEPSGIVREFSEPQKRYEFEVSDLSPSSAYTYTISWSVRDVQFKSPAYQFRTAPPTGSDEPFSLTFFSDCRADVGVGDQSVEGVNYWSLRALLSQAYNLSSSFVLIDGDLVDGFISNPAELGDQFRSYKRAVTPVGAQIPIFEGIGNHDLVHRFFEETTEREYAPRSVDESSEIVFAAHFVNPLNGPDPVSDQFPPYRENVYSFDWGNSHFTVLNNDYMRKGTGKIVADMPGELGGTMRDEQLVWLENDLSGARERGMEHIFVFVHEPAFPNGGHVGGSMWWRGKKPEIVSMRDRFWKILCDHEVLAAFSGHEHNFSLALIDSTVDSSFEVSVWQVVSGGGGAPFYAQDLNTPWAHTVKSFYPLTHFCQIDVQEDHVLMTVYDPDGNVISEHELTGIR
jgi:hypothetical protein